MRGLFRNTPGGKAGTIDGLNLFFGALLGANLGTMQGLGLYDYVKIIVLLAGTVIVIRLVSTSERKLYVAANVVLYVVLIGALLLYPAFQPKGVAPADLQRLAATLAIWFALVLISELLPANEEAGTK
jgi:predicted membrane channel-forming protein YqfA (hemolysin III family)